MGTIIFFFWDELNSSWLNCHSLTDTNNNSNYCWRSTGRDEIPNLFHKLSPSNSLLKFSFLLIWFSSRELFLFPERTSKVQVYWFSNMNQRLIFALLSERFFFVGFLWLNVFERTGEWKNYHFLIISIDCPLLPLDAHQTLDLLYIYIIVLDGSHLYPLPLPGAVHAQHSDKYACILFIE